jgi:hypothetical protein
LGSAAASPCTVTFNGGTLSFKLREEDTATGAGAGAASASGTALSVFLFFPFLLFLAEEEADAPRGASLLPDAIPMVTSLPALIPGGAVMSSSLRPGIGLCVTRVARAQREGAARSGRREGCVPWRRPKEMDISCSRMDCSRRRMCLSTFVSRPGQNGEAERRKNKLSRTES